MGVFDKIFTALVQADGIPKQLQIDATYLKAHRTASRLLKKRDVSRAIGHTKAPEGIKRIKYKVACCL